MTEPTRNNGQTAALQISEFTASFRPRIIAITCGYYRTSSPVTALPLIMRWISDVPSKIVKLVEVRAVSAARWPDRQALVSTSSAPDCRPPRSASGDDIEARLPGRQRDAPTHARAPAANVRIAWLPQAQRRAGQCGPAGRAGGPWAAVLTGERSLLPPAWLMAGRPLARLRSERGESGFGDECFRHGTGAAMYVVGRFQPDTLMTGVLPCRSDEP